MVAAQYETAGSNAGRIELVELPDIGHTPQLEAPDVFLNIASLWFDRVAATSGGRQGATAGLDLAANG